MKNLSKVASVTALTTVMSLAMALPALAQTTTDITDTKPSYRQEMVKKWKQIKKTNHIKKEMKGNQAILDAIKNNDYQAWHDQMIKIFTTTEAQKYLTQDLFDTMVKIHQLRQEGKYQEAIALRKESNIKELFRAERKNTKLIKKNAHETVKTQSNTSS